MKDRTTNRPITLKVDANPIELEIVAAYAKTRGHESAADYLSEVVRREIDLCRSREFDKEILRKLKGLGYM